MQESEKQFNIPESIPEPKGGVIESEEGVGVPVFATETKNDAVVKPETKRTEKWKEKRRIISFKIALNAKSEFDPYAQSLLEKFENGKLIFKKDKRVLARARNEFWKKFFGKEFGGWDGIFSEDMAEALKGRGIDVTKDAFSKFSVPVKEKSSKSAIDTGKRVLPRLEETNEAGFEIAKSTRGYLEMMWGARHGFSDEMQMLLRKRIFEKKFLTSKEQLYFDKERDLWWRENFGKAFSRSSRRRKAKISYTELKHGRMEKLASSLYAIDHGKNIEELSGERRFIYYDDFQDTFYIFEKEKRRDIYIGDILADYAWGIKYVPDPEMPHSVFRQLTKKILVNEARRDIERLYSRELSEACGVPMGVSDRVDESLLEKLYLQKKHEGGMRGVIGEGVVREFLSRLSVNEPSLGFAVERSNAYEDTFLRYDFKLNRKKRTRGVALEGLDAPREKYIEEKKLLGIQLTIGRRAGGKRATIEIGKNNIKKPSGYVKKKVDDIILLHIQLNSLADYFTRWLREGKPAGGPEQYLNAEEKREILKKVMENFIPLTNEEIDRIISNREHKAVLQKAA